MPAPMPDAGAIHPDAALGIARIMNRPEVPLTATIIADPTRLAVAEKARERLSLGKAEDSLRILSGEIVPYRPEETKQVLISRFSTERGPDGRKKAPSNVRERQRLTSATTEVDNVREFLEKGDAAPAAVDALATHLKNHLYTNSPVLRQLFDSYGGLANPGVDAYVRDFMKSPGFRELLQGRYREVLNPITGKKIEGEAEIGALRAAVHELEARLKLVPNKTAVDTAKAEYEAARRKRALGRTKEEEMERKVSDRDRLSRSVAGAQATFDRWDGTSVITTLQSQLTTAEADLATLVASGTPVTDPSYLAADKKVNDLNKNDKLSSYLSARAVLDRNDGLNNDISKLAKDVDKLVADEAAKKEAYEALVGSDKGLTPEQKVQLEHELEMKKAELADAQDDLEMKMISFHRDVTHMAQDAADGALNASFGDAKQAYKDEAEKAAGKAKTAEGERAEVAADKVANLWKTRKSFRPNWLERKFRMSPNQFVIWESNLFKIDKHMSRLTHGGPAEVADYIRGLTPVQLMQSGMTNDEATAYIKRLTDDGEFRKAQATRLSKDLVADYLSAGGTMTRPVVESIASTSWGTQLIDDAVTRSTEIVTKYGDGNDGAIKQQLDELAQAQKQGRLKEWLVHNATGKGAGLIALKIALLGAAAAGTHGYSLMGAGGAVMDGASHVAKGLGSFVFGP